MTELFQNLTWPGAVAILGSVITIVAGLVALLIQTRTPQTQQKLTSSLPTPEATELHQRVSSLRDRLGTVEGQQLVLKTKMENLIKQCEDHDRRDVDDFKTINAKVDKLMEIIVEMLKDE